MVPGRNKPMFFKRATPYEVKDFGPPQARGLGRSPNYEHKKMGAKPPERKPAAGEPPKK
jgi:hypothetical protein